MCTLAKTNIWQMNLEYSNIYVNNRPSCFVDWIIIVTINTSSKKFAPQIAHKLWALAVSNKNNIGVCAKFIQWFRKHEF